MGQARSPALPQEELTLIHGHLAVELNRGMDKTEPSGRFTKPELLRLGETSRQDMQHAHETFQHAHCASSLCIPI